MRTAQAMLHTLSITIRAPLLPALLLCWLATAPAAALAQAVVELANVTRTSNSSVLRLPGSVISTRDAEISAEIEGRLTWVAEVGQTIQEGGELATIDDHILQLQLRNDRASVARIQADIEYNQRQIKRLEKLARQNNTARSELDQLESQLAMLIQDQRIAEVNRERTAYDLGRSRVRAPFTGVVASREMSTGEYTEPGQALVRLVDTQTLEISVNAPLRVARYIGPGSQVQVESGDKHLLTDVRGVVPVGDRRSRMMELRLVLEPGHWPIGEAVTVEMADGESTPALSVPRDALVLRNNEVYVFTVSGDNKAVKVPVTTGAGRGARIAIQGELQPGDAVVVRGAERLREGQKVKVTQHHLAVSQ